MFRDRDCDAGDVDFLKRVRAHHVTGDLAGDADDRRGIEHRGGDAGHEVRRARAGCRDDHAHAAARAGKAVRHVNRTLLVSHENVADREFEQCIVGWQNRATRIPEYGLHPFPYQGVPQNLRARSMHCRSTHQRARTDRVIESGNDVRKGAISVG